jgi:hypothetical protein
MPNREGEQALRRLYGAAILICVCASLARADDAKMFTFDHYLERPASTKIEHLRPHDKFYIVIANTCPDSLEYTVDQSPRSESSAKPKGVSAILGLDREATPPNPVTSVTKGPITFDPTYGSYAVRIFPKAGPDGAKRCDIFVDPNGTPATPPDAARSDRDFGASNEDEKKIGHWIAADLSPTAQSPDRFTLAIESDEWEVGADGALLFTFAGEPRYTTVDKQIPILDQQGKQTGIQTVKQVTEDVAGEAVGRIAFGTLTHFYFPGRAGGFRHGPTLGFSVLSSSNNQTEYYFGYGLGLGPVVQRLNVAVGLAYSPVATLPAGIDIGSQVADANAIGTLRSVYHWRFFFGLTATVFRGDNQSSSQKPAAPEGK